MVWGCFAYSGVGNLVDIPTTMTKEIYLDILKDNVKQSARRVGLGRFWTYQQDNDPKHTAKVVQKWFVDNKVGLLDWPAQSPDLNPIENLWAIVDRQVRNREDLPRNIKDLYQVLKTEWDQIPVETLQNLVKSMPRRIQACIAAGGGHTKY